MKNLRSLRTLFSACVLLLASIAQAEIAVIVHPSLGLSELDSNYAARLFLGKVKKFPNGEPVIVINQNKGSDTRIKFIKDLMNKSESEYKAYWSRLMFTGKAPPPKDSGDDDAIKKLVSANPNTIGYIDASHIDDTVVNVLSLP